MENKTNAELLQLIADATAELERRRTAAEGDTELEGEGDEGGDHPPTPKFP